MPNQEAYDAKRRENPLEFNPITGDLYQDWERPRSQMAAAGGSPPPRPGGGGSAPMLQAPRIQGRPTFAPPQAPPQMAMNAVAPSATTNAVNPQIAALIQELMNQQFHSGGSGELDRIYRELSSPYTFKQTNSRELDSLLARLARPSKLQAPSTQVNVDNIDNDMEARAYRVARQRELERQREAAAERMSADGLTGSGELDAEVNMIGEGAGQDIAGFNAQLAGRRRSEILNERLTGYNSQLAAEQMEREGLSRSAGLLSQQEAAAYNAKLSAEQMRRQGLLGAAGVLQQQQASKRSSQMDAYNRRLALLNAMMAQEGLGG